MKASTKEKLLYLLDKIDNNVIFEDIMQSYFEVYGDDYYYSSDTGRIELSEENKRWKKKEQ